MKEALSPKAVAGQHVPQEFLDDLPLPYLEIDCHGFITRANRAAAALHPSERGNLIGRMAWEMIASDEMASSFAAFCELLESGETPGVVRRNVFVSSGHFRTFELHRSLIFNAAGKPDGMRLIATDVTETVKAMEEARSTALWLHSVISSIPEPVLVADVMGIVRSVNPAADHFFGWLPGSATGKLVEQVLPLAANDAGTEPLPDFNRVLEAPIRTRLTLLDGSQKPVRMEMMTSPVSDTHSGFLSGVVCVLHKL